MSQVVSPSVEAICARAPSPAYWYPEPTNSTMCLSSGPAPASLLCQVPNTGEMISAPDSTRGRSSQLTTEPPDAAWSNTVRRRIVMPVALTHAPAKDPRVAATLNVLCTSAHPGVRAICVSPSWVLRSIAYSCGKSTAPSARPAPRMVTSHPTTLESCGATCPTTAAIASELASPTASSAATANA